MVTRAFPSEWWLRAGPYRAAIDPVGACLRELTYGGRNLVVPYASGAVRPLYRGAIIAPWPNRVVGGRYRFAGTSYQLPLNEPERGHALHGLVHWARWDLVEVDDEHVVLSHWLVPQEGYPFPLHLVATYLLSDSGGLHTRVVARNVGDRPAPYGLCPHPYLVAGAGRVDDWRLTLPARARLDVDEHLAPTAVHALSAQARFDDRMIGDSRLDHAFTDLVRGEDGSAVVRLEAPGGAGGRRSGVELAWGEWAPWVQVHTADRPEPENDRAGLAVEPMSCPPDAFNSGTDLVVLVPGGRHEADWIIRGF